MGRSLADFLSEFFVWKIKEYYKKRFPFIPKKNFADEELEKVINEQKKGNALVPVVILVLLIALTPLYAWLTHQIYVFIFKNIIAPGCIAYLYRWSTFCIPCCILAFGTVFYPLTFFGKVINGPRYEIIHHVYSLKTGFDYWKAANHFSKVLVALFLISLMPFITSGIVVYQNKFTIKQVYSLAPKTYSSTNISKIIYYSKYIDNLGDIHDDPYFVFKFKDSGSLSSFDWEFNRQSIIMPFLHSFAEKGVVIDTYEDDIKRGYPKQ